MEAELRGRVAATAAAVQEDNINNNSEETRPRSRASKWTAAGAPRSYQIGSINSRPALAAAAMRVEKRRRRQQEDDEEVWSQRDVASSRRAVAAVPALDGGDMLFKRRFHRPQSKGKGPGYFIWVTL
jgi:hypothetical protein